MMTVRLVIKSQDSVEEIANLVWSEGRTEIVRAASDTRSDVERWIREGLREWVGARQDPRPRVTISSDPAFLERVEDYVQRQFGFVTQLRIEGPLHRMILSVDGTNVSGDVPEAAANSFSFGPTTESRAA